MSTARLVTLLGSTYKVDVSALVARSAMLDPHRASVSVSHGFDQIGVSAVATLPQIAAVCDAEHVQRIHQLIDGQAVTCTLELIAAHRTNRALDVRVRIAGARALDADLGRLAGFGVEPQVVDGARAAVTELGAGRLVAITDAVAGDGARTWELRVAQPNGTEPERTAAREHIDRVAAACKISAAQRRVAAGLYDALARDQPMHVWIRGSRRRLSPTVGLVWDRVEWQPIQRMLAGFYPDADPIGRVAELARASEVELATLELVLGPHDPPAMRISVAVEGT